MFFNTSIPPLNNVSILQSVTFESIWRNVSHDIGKHIHPGRDPQRETNVFEAKPLDGKDDDGR